MFRKMFLVGLMLILSASAALCAPWGSDTVWGGYTKCAMYENYNPKTKINPKAYESITLYNSKGLPISDVSFTPDGRVMDSIVFLYSAKGNKKEAEQYDMKGNLKYTTILLRTGKVQTREFISYVGRKEQIVKDKDIVDERGNIVESISYQLHSESDENDEERFFLRRELLKYDEKNTVISEIIISKDTPTDSKKKFEITYKPLYDSLGRLIEYSWYGFKGELKKTFTYEYSADGSKIETQKDFDMHNNDQQITIYNKKGQTTEIISLTPSGIRKTMFSWEYDEFGNLIKRNFYSKVNDEVERTIEYVFSK
jgi:hypothetical protein